MNFMIRVVCCLIFFLLVGCTSYQPNTINKIHVNQCLGICMQHFEMCKQNCNNNCPNCSLAANTSAAVNYNDYLHEKRIEGEPVSRELKSYRDPLQCRKVTCDCVSDLVTCKQSCTGMVQKRLQSITHCT